MTNKAVVLRLEGDRLISTEQLDTEEVSSELYVAPGLIDVQINGYAGVDFNTFPIDERDFLMVIEELVKDGITSFFPTVITNSTEQIIKLLENIDALCTANPLIEDFVEGIHLEGPFISPRDEVSGAHDSQYICAPDWELFEQFIKASNNRIKIVTIAAEWDNAPIFIKKCVERDILVAIGHTIANSEQIHAATEAGARMSTHLGNGAPLSLHRNSNVIIDQLANNGLTASLIADGFHLPESFLKIAIKTKQEQAILVSDSTMFAGMDAGIYESHIGGKIVLEKNKRLSTFKNPELLAGAAVSLLDCVNYLLKKELAELSHCWSMASTYPRRLLGHADTKASVSADADLVLFEIQNNEIIIDSVIKKGEIIYTRDTIKNKENV